MCYCDAKYGNYDYYYSHLLFGWRMRGSLAFMSEMARRWSLYSLAERRRFCARVHVDKRINHGV